MLEFVSKCRVNERKPLFMKFIGQKNEIGDQILFIFGLERDVLVIVKERCTQSWINSGKSF